MGYTGIPLNVATVLVASIAMGIGIDYSIHVITHFNESLTKGSNVYQALEDTIGISGKAIAINVISVSAGFLILLFSEMVPLQYFGLLIFLSMVGSGLGALTFLPVILILAHKDRDPFKNTQKEKKLNGNINYKMMKTIKYISLLLVLMLSGCMLDAKAQDAASILAKMDKIIFSPKDKQGKVTIILTDRTGKEKVREATMLQKGRDKKLYRYTKPESQAGIATLSLSNDVMWLYMPAFEKPKKISMLAKDQSFTGTDFSYEDMVTTPYSDRYTPTLLSSEGNIYLLKLIPKSGKSNYSKVFVKIDKANGYPVSMEFFNRMDKKFKESNYKFEKVGEYWNAAEVTMMDYEKNHATKILLQDVKFDQGLSDDLFLVEKLIPAEKKKESKQAGSSNE